MKALVISGKGGVGKTFISLQVLLPYLAERGKVFLYSVDACNVSDLLKNSAFLEKCEIKTGFDNFPNFWTDVYLNKNVIVDVGTFYVQNFVKYAGLENLFDEFDVIFIPVDESKLSVEFALSFKDVIKKATDEKKIYFVLSKVPFELELSFNKLEAMKNLYPHFFSVPFAVNNGFVEKVLAVPFVNHSLKYAESSKVTILEILQKFSYAEVKEKIDQLKKTENVTREEVERLQFQKILIAEAYKMKVFLNRNFYQKVFSEPF